MRLQLSSSKLVGLTLTYRRMVSPHALKNCVAVQRCAKSTYNNAAHEIDLYYHGMDPLVPPPFDVATEQKARERRMRT